MSISSSFACEDYLPIDFPLYLQMHIYILIQQESPTHEDTPVASSTPKPSSLSQDDTSINSSQDAGYVSLKPESQLTLANKVRLKLAAESGDIASMGKAVLKIASLKEHILSELTTSVGQRPATLGRRKLGKLSILMQKGYCDMTDFDTRKVVHEFKTEFPEVYEMVLAVMLPKEKHGQKESYEEIIPRLSMLYGLLMQTRNQELSLVQHVVTMCLNDNICDQKVIRQLYYLLHVCIHR